jgi:hypothetical protein
MSPDGCDLRIAVAVMPHAADRRLGMPLAYLPQRVAEVMLLSFGVPIFAKGLQAIVTGRMREVAWIRDWAIWRVRAVGLLLAAAGHYLASGSP